MSKGKIISIIIILVVISLAVYYLNSNSEIIGEATNSGVNQNQQNPKDYYIDITSSGFNSNSLVIKQGDTVIWTNKDSKPRWLASAIHPTHTVYPGSDIKKCGTDEESNIFDSCRGISPGESYSFTFNEKGKWNYHDHLIVGHYGSISVE